MTIPLGLDELKCIRRNIKDKLFSAENQNPNALESRAITLIEELLLSDFPDQTIYVIGGYFYAGPYQRVSRNSFSILSSTFSREYAEDLRDREYCDRHTLIWARRSERSHSEGKVKPHKIKLHILDTTPRLFCDDRVIYKEKELRLLRLRSDHVRDYLETFDDSFVERKLKNLVFGGIYSGLEDEIKLLENRKNPV